MSDLKNRPDGELFIIGANLNLVGSVFCWIMGYNYADKASAVDTLNTNPLSDLIEDPAKVAEATIHLQDAVWYYGLSWNLFLVFLAFICTGYIVRALSFLPGKEAAND